MLEFLLILFSTSWTILGLDGRLALAKLHVAYVKETLYLVISFASVLTRFFKFLLRNMILEHTWKIFYLH